MAIERGKDDSTQSKSMRRNRAMPERASHDRRPAADAATAANHDGGLAHARDSLLAEEGIT